MGSPHRAKAAAICADSSCASRGGLPNDVKALKALVIELHGRAQEQERHIKRQRERLRILAHKIGLGMVALEPRADHHVLEQDEANLILHSMCPSNDAKPW